MNLHVFRLISVWLFARVGTLAVALETITANYTAGALRLDDALLKGTGTELGGLRTGHLDLALAGESGRLE